jgi:hypothetical protein
MKKKSKGNSSKVLRKSKKGDVNQTFMFLTAAIITGVILIFGGASFLRLIDNTEKIQATQFRSDFEDAIHSISSKYGSVRYVDFTSLDRYTEMCVFSLRNPSSITEQECPVLAKHPLIRGDLEDMTANVFLLDIDGISDRFINTDLELEDNAHCTCQEVGSGGSVRVRLEGLGKKASFEFVNQTSS